MVSTFQNLQVFTKWTRGTSYNQYDELVIRDKIVGKQKWI